MVERKTITLRADLILQSAQSALGGEGRNRQNDFSGNCYAIKLRI